ncbi:MAG: DUF1415 domain-containing protein [Steroidobacteraceae bacterium]
MRAIAICVALNMLDGFDVLVMASPLPEWRANAVAGSEPLGRARDYRKLARVKLAPEQVITHTRAWVDHAVIGLNLCPFAKAVQVRNAVRYVVSETTGIEELLAELLHEMTHLIDTDASVLDTTLLIHPWVLNDFFEYNDFLGVADDALQQAGFEGVLQVASFHPQFQFAGTDAEDVTNATNRSPYPTLHLLREDSVDRAVAAFPQAESIYQKNIQTLRALGADGWAELRDSLWGGPGCS